MKYSQILTKRSTFNSNIYFNLKLTDLSPIFLLEKFVYLGRLEMGVVLDLFPGVTELEP